MRPVYVLAFAALALAGCAATKRQAVPPPVETVVEDDDLLLHDPAQLPRTLGTLKALEVDRERLRPDRSWASTGPAFSTRTDGVFVRRGFRRGTYRLRWGSRFSLPVAG